MLAAQCHELRQFVSRIASTYSLIAFVLAAGSTPLAQDSPHPARDNGSVQVQMHNVMYHYPNDIVVHLRNVAGALVPSKEGQFPVFDDKESFSLHITAAEIAMDPQSLANVLNSNVFSGKDAPLKDISIRIEKDRLKVKGKLHKKGDIGFETEGQLTATPDGKIRLHSEKIKALRSQNAVEAAPTRTAKRQVSAEEPVTARIRRRSEPTPHAAPARVSRHGRVREAGLPRAGYAPGGDRLLR